MNVQTLPLARPRTPAAIRWPAPPFFQLATDASSERGRACVVEFMDGRSLSCDLLYFEPHAPSILVRGGGADPQLVALRRIRTLTLSTPLALVRNGDAIRNVGAAADCVAEERSFVVAFRDGQQMTGTTRGFLKDGGGLSLYLVLEHPLLAVACFIPACHLSDVQIGPTLGSALTDRHAVSADAVAAALARQEQLRHKRLGEYLTDHAIVSAPALMRALREQRHTPSLRLGDFLVEAGLVTPAQLRKALRLQTRDRRRRVGDILIAMGAVTLRQIQEALAEKLGIPFVDVRSFPIDPAALLTLEESLAVKHQVLALLRTEDSVVVAVENPLALDFIQHVQFAGGMNVAPVIASPTDLRARIVAEYAAARAAPKPVPAAAPPEVLLSLRLEDPR